MDCEGVIAAKPGLFLHWIDPEGPVDEAGSFRAVYRRSRIVAFAVAQVRGGIRSVAVPMHGHFHREYDHHIAAGDSGFDARYWAVTRLGRELDRSIDDHTTGLYVYRDKYEND